MISIRFMQTRSDEAWTPKTVTWSTGEAPAPGDHLELAPDTLNTGGVRGHVLSRIWVNPGQIILVGKWSQLPALKVFSTGLETEAA